jgi:hypothetical protein
MSEPSTDAWRKVQNMPWTATLDLRRLAWPLIRAQFAWHGISWGRGWKIFGRPIIQRHRGSRIARRDGRRCPTCTEVP